MATSDLTSGREVHITVPIDSAGERLDKFLGASSDLDISRSRAQKLITEKLVTVNGLVVAGKYKLSDGEAIVVTLPPARSSDIVGEDIQLDIIYEDDYLAVVNKPAGMVTHPAVGNYSGTLVNALIHHFGHLSQHSGTDRPGIVHRLDKNTSGLLVVARDDQTAVTLQKAIQSREIKRTYLAVIWGHFKEESGTIELPIGRSMKDRTRMSVGGAAEREAITHYRVLDSFRSYQLVEVTLGTGRTHQIRVHFSHLGHSPLGDPDYGGREKHLKSLFGPERPLAKRLLSLIPRQVLHAIRLEFVHPVDGRELRFEAPVPGDFQAVLDLLNAEGR
ncbi:MAG: RNA pseudouridine synthase [Candidatus Zixiibacteriota bacterium]|nr:MAG: RNA pseudouridine synthase [candidate division Zixibacteria bacterium]